MATAETKKLHVEIISPQGIVFDGYCEMATVPSTSGDLGIMFNHEPTLSRLREGKVSIYEKKDNKVSKTFDVKEGFAQNLEDKLIILADH